VGHTELEGNSATITNVAAQAMDAASGIPSLDISSAPSDCSSDIFCGGSPGTMFLFGGESSVGYTAGNTVTEYLLDNTGSVTPNFSWLPVASDRSIPRTWDQTVCPSTPLALSYFAVDAATQRSSNAVAEYVTGDCGQSVIQAACTVNGSTSPSTGVVSVFYLYNVTPNPVSGTSCDWDPGSPLPGAFDTPPGSSCISVGFTATTAGIFSESVTLTNGANSLKLGCPAFTVQDFDLSVTPMSPTTSPASSVEYTVTASSVYGFGGQIIFSQATTLPSGLSFTWSPNNSCTVPAGGSCFVIYTVTVAAGTDSSESALQFVGTHPENL